MPPERAELFNILALYYISSWFYFIGCLLAIFNTVLIRSISDLNISVSYLVIGSIDISFYLSIFISFWVYTTLLLLINQHRHDSVHSYLGI